MVYKDRWWCEKNNCANFSTCDRAMTDSEAEKAKEWGNAPIQFNENPKCFKEK
jgi:hypothetical protein